MERIIRGVIFDMDGVILDSEVYARKAYQEICREKGIEYDDGFYRRLFGINYDYAHKLFLKYYGPDEQFITSLQDGYLNLLMRWIAEGVVPFKPGAIELISWLNEHDFPICLATSSGMTKIRSAYNSHGLEVPFRYIVTGEDVILSKPDPEIFLKAAGRMGLNIEECMVVEDSYQGVQAAIACNSVSCMVPDILEPTDEMKEQLCYLKKDLFEVLEILKPYVNP
ncbi:MAG: HAD family phosphatase [Erysipelotrichaceae bacterium]|nr:HAD family phosphatase [Erysipelotrichaceae bacterium]